VAVEVARENAVEQCVREGQRHGIADDHARVRHSPRRDLDHASALVERDHVAAQVAGEETCAAGDIQHASRGQPAHQADELLDLLGPTRSLARLEQPGSEPPVVVFERAPVVVRAYLLVHHSLDHDPGRYL